MLKNYLNFLFLCLLAGPVQAQPSSLWGDLEPGPHRVGFDVRWTYDYARTWQPEDNYKGERRPVEAARPIRITVWYPVEQPADATPMPYSGYVGLEPDDPRFADYAERLNAYDLGHEQQGLRGLFRGAQEPFETLLNTPTAAFEKAAPKDGAFPLIVYSLGQNDYTQENVVLWEYLASYGYVVATIPHLGTSPRRFHLFIHDPPSYEAQVRDLEFVVQEMRDFPGVDPDRIAAVGHSMGGVYALLLALRNSNVDAVAGLDGSFTFPQASYAYKYWEAPYYDPTQLNAPLLQLYRPSDDFMHDRLDALRHADRYLVAFPNLTHSDFTSYPMVTTHADPEVLAADDLQVRSPDTARRGYQRVTRYLRNFLEAHLKEDAQAQQFFQGLSKERDIEYTFRPGLKVPTEEAFYTIIAEEGLEKAIDVYRAVRDQYPAADIIRETVLNRIGYEMIYSGQAAKAIPVFRLNVIAHPESAEAYDSLAEGYLTIGDTEQAIKNYEQSLELDPDNQNAIDKLQSLREQ